jgi:hypothetical protein
VSETTGTPSLNEALAKFQAALPRVGKGEQADVPGKDGKRGYSYKYADLADISRAVLPLLGQFGLAFTAKPTVLESGAFALHYKLTHSSGEVDEGYYLLPSPERTGPQQVGSAITYARRYCLCAVTGIHPDGEDDDGARAQSAPYSAADAWENAAPAPRPQRPAPPNGQTVRPAPGDKPSVVANGEPDMDAQQYADEAHEARTLGVLQDIQKRAREAGKLTAVIINPATQGKGRLVEFIDFHRKRLKEVEDALKALNDAANNARMPVTEVDIHVKKVTGKDIESATAAELRQAAEALMAVPA